MALLVRNSKSSIYKGLNSFWVKYFKDSLQLEAVYTGAEQLLSQVYLDLMEIILSKSLSNIPIFKREEYKLLILQQDKLTRDPAVASFSTTKESNGVIFSIKADTTTTSHDGTSIVITDIANITDLDKKYFPYVGFFNDSLVGRSSTTPEPWTIVVPSNKTIWEAIREVKSQVISNKPIASLTGAGDAIFTLSYNEEVHDINVTITAAEQSALTNLEGLQTLLSSKITNSNITVSIESGYLLIKATPGNTVRVTSANVAAVNWLFIKPFNFLLSVDIPSEYEKTLTWSYTHYIKFKTGGYQAEGTEYRYQLATSGNQQVVRSAKYVTNTLYEPSLVLEEHKHFRVAKGYIYFKTNPFTLPHVAYRLAGDSTQIALWLGDVLFDNTLLYERYGYRFTDKQESSEAYKLLLRGLVFYYIKGPDIKGITSVLNLVAGIPVALEDGEVVTSATVGTGVITTNLHTYEVPSTATPLVSVGDTLQAFDALVDVFVVEDYVKSPTWFDRTTVPNTLMPVVSLAQRQLQKTVVIPKIGAPGFVVGNLNSAESSLLTGKISTYGAFPNLYALPQDAYFVMELPDAGIIINALVPKSFTANVKTLAELALVISNALRQVTCRPYNSLNLSHDATFKCNDTVISIPKANYTNIAAVLNEINSDLPSGIQAYLSYDSKAIVFMTPTGKNISIHSVSLTAHVALGIQGSNSFTGIQVSAEDNHLRFRNISHTSDSFLKVYNENAVALNAWALHPFREGSGNMIGEQGQSNVAYLLFDEILKYTTFKVSFSMAHLDSDVSLDSLVDIVFKGRPQYITPLITPVREFSDTMSESHEVPGVIGDNDIVPFAQRDTFTAPNAATKAEYFDSEIGAGAKIVFSTIPEMRVLWDNTTKKASFITLGKAGVTFVASVSPFSAFRFDSKDSIAYTRYNHRITFGVEDSLAPAEELLFSNPGIYNYGIQSRGTPYGPLTLERVKNVGSHSIGVYKAETPSRAAIDWVHGTYKSEIDSRADTIFLLGESRPAALRDLGFGEGDFLELQGWPNSGNNGRFTILSVSYNVNTPYGLVDILWYQNKNAVEDNMSTGKSVTDGSKYTLSYKPSSIGKYWFITIPKGKSMGEIYTSLSDTNVSGDDRKVFPFDFQLVGEASATWTTTSLQHAYTKYAENEERSYIGERMQVSYDTERKFLLGSGYYDYFTGNIVPYILGPIIFSNGGAPKLGKRVLGKDVPTANAKIIGEPSHVVGPALTIGATKTYNGGEYSTLDQLRVSYGVLGVTMPTGHTYLEYTPGGVLIPPPY